MTDINEYNSDPDPRLPRGYLELDVDHICREYIAGKHTLKEGKFLTPHMVGTLLIAETDGERKRPSSGAIAAVFERWLDLGYAEFRREPFAFIRYTNLGLVSGSWQGFQASQD